MNPELMKRLCQAFLMYKFPNHYQVSWLDNDRTCGHLTEAIDRINGWGDELLNLSTLESNPEHFASFLSLLDKALTFDRRNPPRSTYDEEALDANMDNPQNFWIQLAPDLPDSNYTSRTTRPEPNDQINVTFNNRDGNQETRTFEELREVATKTLIRVLAEKMPRVKLKDLEKKISELEALVEQEKKHLKSQESRGHKPDTSNLDAMEVDLNLLKDVNKVLNLSVIMIPNEDGTPARHCVLRDSAGGVTEKYSLIKTEDAVNQLVHLYNNHDTDATNYLANRRDYKLSTQGILKLPKHGKTTEVQREAIALNISRILGFTTTQSTTVEHDGKAALFIPFDNIQLLNEFADGEIQHVVLPSSLSGIKKIGEEYLHYSTIVPVGNRLNSEQIVDDFGKVMAFSYLCNDTDFIGMKNQNKALKDGSQLYMFDQVIMSKEKMSLDSRLSLVPIGMGRHSRHNQGRNRSIIEDSSFAAKFKSISDLVQHKTEINLMLDNIIYSHLSKLSKIQNSIEAITAKGKTLSPQDKLELTRLKAQQKEVELLREDAIAVKHTVNQRMETMFTNFPSLNGQAMNSRLFLRNQPLLRSCLALEKLVNCPVLFTDDGRPYRNPWTYRNTNTIESINIDGENAHIKFSSVNNSQMIAILMQAGVDLTHYDKHGSTITLPVSELTKINENCLFPERSLFNLQTDYLDPEILKQNFLGYEDGKHQPMLISRLFDYQQEASKTMVSNPQQTVAAMQSMLNTIGELYKTANKGMLKHAELNLQLDMQQKLQAMVLQAHPELAADLMGAFDAAVKLDSLNDLNHVLMNYVSYGCKNTPLLEEYLGKCIAHGANAGNYTQAKTESDALYIESVDLYRAFSHRQENSVSQIMGSLNEHALHDPVVLLEEDWDDVDVPKLHEIKKKEEEESLNEAISESVKAPSNDNVGTSGVTNPGIPIGGKF